MWILKWLPDWLFYCTFFAGLAALGVSFILPLYRTAIRAVSAFVILGSAYMCGGIADNNAWQARVDEMQAKVATAEAKSQQETVKIVTKIQTKTQYYRTKGEDIIKYIDKEIIKYNNQCVIPKEFIEVINRASTE